MGAGSLGEACPRCRWKELGFKSHLEEESAIGNRALTSLCNV